MRYFWGSMITSGDRHSRSRALTVLVLGFALVATVLLSTAAPHLHLGRDPGFFNQEHDLSLFVAASAYAPLPEGPPVIVLGGVVAHTVLVPTSQPASHPGRLSDSRAPPLV